ncbi:MAG: winged helix-turn-helix domain-containing protein [Alphaproteobacteria bacterium]|nr:winged helix-turn-helix domain-containing protein [Alphaproteobacteria bacterium]
MAVDGALAWSQQSGLSGGSIAPSSFPVGKWQADPILCTITAGSVVRKLEPRLMKLLDVICRSNGSLVTKERLLQKVWEGKVVGDDTIASAISRLRLALDDDSRRQELIKTVSRRGYVLARPIPHSGREKSESTDAAALCARGRELLRHGTAPGLEQARVYFEAACQQAPADAAAHAGFGCVRLTQFFAGYASREACLVPARKAARRAVELDKNCSLGWAAFGFAQFMSAGAVPECEAAFKGALSNEGDHSIACRWYALFLLSQKRFDEAEIIARRALALEPYTLAAIRVLIQVLLAARRYKIVLEEAEAALTLSEGELAIWFWAGCAHKFLGHESAAYAAFRMSFGSSFDPRTRDRCDSAFQRGGLKGLFRLMAARQEEGDVVMRPLDRAIVCSFAGEHVRATRFLVLASQHGDPQLSWLHVLPHFDDLRGQPAFDKLVRAHQARLRVE